MCKSNSAAHDRIITPHCPKQAAFIKWVAELPIRPNNHPCKSRCHHRTALNAGANYILQGICMRHNNTYILCGEQPDVQTEKVRPKNARVETDWHAQPAPRLGLRHLVQRESILRSEGFSSGPLRDAAPAHHGRSLDRRCRYKVRRFTPHRLSGSGSIPASWPERFAAKAPWPQSKAQTVCRGHRACAGVAICRAGLDDHRLCPSDSAKVRNHGSPAEPGTGVSEQKKPRNQA
jgi:hypothetical protein